ncbi:MAG: DUF1287 domain-containing protein [Flavobacterium sp.]|nr:DUF1287 domain-containing protein [Flavobacterium sp.]
MKNLVFPLTLLALYLSCKNPKTENTIVISKQLSLIKTPITFEEKLSNAALSVVDPTIDYDPTYFSIPYPNGDVPKNKGVCTDVVIRSYRKLGIDLQKEVHEDMKINFSKYPTKWGLKKTDTNIDHRRVLNLEVFFTRKGQKLAITDNPNDYKAGEIVTWMVNKKLPHIGIITHQKSADGKRPMIVHNIGNGQVLEDCLFEFKIVGHFKFNK